MLNVVKKSIDEFYIKKNYSLFKSMSRHTIGLPQELHAHINSHRFSLDESINDFSPSKDWYIGFDHYKRHEFEVSYTTIFKISKVAPLFYVQHEFEVENKDENRMTPVLSGFDGQPYTKQQADLHDTISKSLIENNYHELTYADLNECVPGFVMPQEVSIFGPNVTVEHLLFIDVFNICDVR